VLGLERYIAVTGPDAYVVEPIDVGVAGISSVFWDEHRGESEAVPEDRLAVVHDAVPNQLFFVFGFAEKNSRFFFDTLEVDGTAYLCREGPLPSHPRLDRQINFALEYNRDLATSFWRARSAGPARYERIIGVEHHQVRRVHP
jgi:hypothetical protein